MAQHVVMGAMLKCSFGVAPSPLTVMRPNILSSNFPAANIMDMAPMVNVMPFGMCLTQSNPAVAAATAAASGVPTPAPCIPAPAGPWKPGNPKALIAGQPALTNSCTLNCAYGGVIQFTNAGQVKHTTG